MRGDRFIIHKLYLNLRSLKFSSGSVKLRSCWKDLRLIFGLSIYGR